MSFELNYLIYLGITIFLAFWVKYLFNKIRLPEVTGYVLVGILFGVSIFKFYTAPILDDMESITTIALGIIAFLIGIELKYSIIKKLGKSILFIVIFECFGAFIIVFLAMYFFFHGELTFPLILGSVAAATAPAATVTVLRQYKAKGNLTKTILAVVGIDDAAALIIYSIASSFTKAILTGVHINALGIIFSALLSVLLALFIGAFAAVIFVLFLKNIKSNELILILLSSFLLLLLGITEELHISELLAIMSFGAIIANLSPTISMKAEEIVQHFAPIFLAAFFIFGGAHLNVTLLFKIGILGLIFFVARSIGKIGGASIGAILGKAPSNIRKYIGFALLPQVGVALALALSVKKTFDIPKYGQTGHDLSVTVINVLLFTTILTEIIGPMLTRHVLQKAGEIQLNSQEE